jgi:hypothetical protein
MVPETVRDRPPRLERPIPFLWLGLSVAWAVVVFVTDQPALWLALWIATTVGPIAFISSHDRTNRSGGVESADPDSKG